MGGTGLEPVEEPAALVAEGDPEPGAAMGRDVGHINAVEARGNLVEEVSGGAPGSQLP